MTRVNLIPPRQLHYRHLVAEYREISRVYGLARAWNARGRDTKVPAAYTMGKGHVSFFYDKLGFIRERYAELVAEMRRRGYAVNHPELPMRDIPEDLFGTYVPTEDAVRINLRRLAESLERMLEGEEGSA